MHLGNKTAQIFTRGDPREIANSRGTARRIVATRIGPPEGLSRLVRTQLPSQLDEHGAAGGIELPRIELIKIAFGIPAQQLQELPPLELAQATHELHHAARRMPNHDHALRSRVGEPPCNLASFSS